ncbi:MAG: peroxiredoxin [Ottowia sp.]|nr:peroxiredoxin [Ottowia sp.]
MIKVGDPLPAVTLTESVDGAPTPVEVAKAAEGKTIALFAVPGAFTPTCSNQHVPSFLDNRAALSAAGVDEIWCLAVNDPFVMDAWAKTQGTAGKIRMLADGNAEFAKAVGLTLDASGLGLGLRSQRYSMLVKNGKVATLNVEGDPNKAEVSDGATLLAQARS